MRINSEKAIVLGTAMTLLVFGVFSVWSVFNAVHRVSNAQPSVKMAASKLEGQIPVLMYHYIGNVPANPDRYRRDLTVSSEDFSAQMDFLKNSGYTTITTVQLFEALQGQRTLPAKPVIVTFDDGYADTFNNAVPILKAKGMVGVFAVITEYVGTPSYAPWDSIVAANNSGMEIIPHTRHHIDLADPKYTEAEKVDEIQGSIQDLKNRLGVNTLSFVYPYGHYTKEAEDILKKAGILFAFTTDYGWYQQGGNSLKIPRVRVHSQETIQRFSDLLIGNKID